MKFEKYVPYLIGIALILIGLCFIGASVAWRKAFSTPWGVDPEKYDPDYDPNAPFGSMNADRSTVEPVRWDSAGTVVSATMLGDSHLVTVIKTEKMVFFLRKPIGAVRIGAKVEHGWTFRHGDWIRLDGDKPSTYRLLPDGMLSPTGKKLR